MELLPRAHSRNEIKRTKASDGVSDCERPFAPSASWRPHEVKDRQVRRRKIKGVARQGEADAGHQHFLHRSF